MYLDDQTKTLFLLGTLPTSTIDKSSTRDLSNERVNAIVTLERLPFPNESPHILSSLTRVVNLSKLNENDVYSWFKGHLSNPKEKEIHSLPPFDLKFQVICPATETQIKKYSKQNRIQVRESFDLFQSVVKPFILDQPLSRIQW